METCKFKLATPKHRRHWETVLESIPLVPDMPESVLENNSTMSEDVWDSDMQGRSSNCGKSSKSGVKALFFLLWRASVTKRLVPWAVSIGSRGPPVDPPLEWSVIC